MVPGWDWEGLLGARSATYSSRLAHCCLGQAWSSVPTNFKMCGAMLVVAQNVRLPRMSLCGSGSREGARCLGG